MKKRNLAFCLLCTMGILTSCNNLSTLGGEEQTLQFKDISAYSSISGIKLLQKSFSPTLNFKKKTYSEDEKATILEDIDLVQEMMDTSLNISSVTESNKEEYESMYTISTKNLNGTIQEYTVYFNLLLQESDAEESISVENSNSNEEISFVNSKTQCSNGSGHHGSNGHAGGCLDDFNTIEKMDINLIGCIVMGDMEYQLEGRQVYNDSVANMQFKVSIDEFNYVSIQQLDHEKHTKFVYTQYTNDGVSYKKEIKYEKREDVIVGFDLKELKDGSSSHYKYKLVTNRNNKFIIVKIDTDEENKSIKVHIEFDENGNIQYRFE